MAYSFDPKKHFNSHDNYISDNKNIDHRTNVAKGLGYKSKNGNYYETWKGCEEADKIYKEDMYKEPPKGRGR